jgi:hypothetical protein
MGITRPGLQERGRVFPPFDRWRVRLTADNAAFLQPIQRGTIAVKPRGSRPRGQQVGFSAGSAVEADTIICCTGNALGFPFLPGPLLKVERNRVELYKYVFHPDRPTPAFVGIWTVLGAHLPGAEMQARWVARVLAGRMPLPSPRRCPRRSSVSGPILVASVRSLWWWIPGSTWRKWLTSGGGSTPLASSARSSKVVFGPFAAAPYRLEGPGRTL